MASSKRVPAPATPTPNTPPSTSQRVWREVRGYAEALLIALFVTTFLFTTVGVIGGSMTPNLRGGSGPFLQAFFSGDRVFIPKYDTWLRRAGVLGPYQRGDVVVFREPENSPAMQGRRNFYVKRMIGLPGDRVKVEEGQVYINGHAVDQGFITDTGVVRPDPVNFPEVVVRDGRVTHIGGPTLYNLGLEVGLVSDPRVRFFYGSTYQALAPLPDEVVAASYEAPVRFVHEFIVPEGQYFIMGDNRSIALGGSIDSRYFGPIPSLSVAGKATAIIWPPQRDGEWNWRRLPPPPAFDAVPEPEPRS
ncbi:signal peptidase I [soil metagenome]